MPSGYLESEAGQREFAKLGIAYPKTLQDEFYDEWSRKENTSADRLSEYSRHKEREVTSITRVRNGSDSKEYLLYSFVHYRLDKALNVTHRFRPQVGKYPIPQAEFSIQRTDFGGEERKFKEIVNTETGYFIPFTTKKLDEIKNIGLDLGGKVSYSVVTDNGLRVTVASYDDLRNGDYDEVCHFGRIPTETQRKAWLEREGGPAKDRERYDEIKMQKDNRDIPQRTPTINEVKSMIEEASSKKQQQHEKEVTTIIEDKRHKGKPSSHSTTKK